MLFIFTFCVSKILKHVLFKIMQDAKCSTVNIIVHLCKATHLIIRFSSKLRTDTRHKPTALFFFLRIRDKDSSRGFHLSSTDDFLHRAERLLS